MSTVAEIEEAIERLPAREQAALFQYLEAAMRQREKQRAFPLVPPTGQVITQQEIDDAFETD